ncbi:tyrosine 3-monooxygenase [Saccoglossus kowalevskii]
MNSTTLNNVYTGRRQSLIEDARNASFDYSALPSPSEDEVFHEFNDDSPVISPSERVKRMAITFGLSEGCYAAALGNALKIFEDREATLLHIESRPSKTIDEVHEFYIKCEARIHVCKNLVASLKEVASHVTLHDEKIKKDKKEVPWFPKKISELDKCTHLMTQYEPDLDSEHPGFSDKNYRERRKEITEIAFNYKHGQVIPRVEYTKEETKTWRVVYRSLKETYPTHACSQHNRVFRLLEERGLYSENKIPQLEDVSNFIKQQTGFQLRPVAGLLSARDFLASLAFRVFQCTQYIRHSSSPMHTPEPDCCHELLGHVPILADPNFAQFSQQIGLASLGVSDDDITKLATLYWFSVEFGLCKQDGEIKAYGAGLLSAYGELLYALSDEPEQRPFNPDTTALQEYRDDCYQPVYFVAESFEDAKHKLREYAAKLDRPFEVRYNPFNQTIDVLDNKEKIQAMANSLQVEINALCCAMAKID